MGLLDPTGARPRDLHEAAQALESMMLQQVLKASGAFQGKESVAGSQTRADLFVGALADAVANAGGIGLAAQLEAQLAPVGPPSSMTAAGTIPPRPGPGDVTNLTATTAERTPIAPHPDHFLPAPRMGSTMKVIAPSRALKVYDASDESSK